MFSKYSVYFTPILNSDSSTYGDEIDVSDRITIDGVGSILRSVDAGDYDVGVFTFSDLTLKGYNYNGYFNDENDVRSIFKSTRDRCKVRVVFHKVDPERDIQGTILSETETDTITFRGLINKGTRLDVVTEDITFKVLSRDSVLRTTKVQGGTVNSNMLCSKAMFNILSQPKIESVLTILESNITPAIDLTIDIGEKFNDKSVKDALNDLLLATSSVLLIDDAGVVTISSRDKDVLADALNLYGKSDEQGRENIIDITAYNSGRQRMFTAVKVNNTEITNNVFVTAFGYRQKAFNLDWVTDSDTEGSIAARLVDEFKFPKIELNVKVSTDVAKDVQLLDLVSVNYPLRTKPIDGTFLPVVGSSKIDDAMTPLPWTFGAIEIKPRLAFKVIEIDENPNEFTSILKLRQTGKGYSDGVFDFPGNSKIDFAIVGEAKVRTGGTACDTYNPSVWEPPK